MIYVFSKKGAYYNRIDDKVEGKTGYISKECNIKSNTYNKAEVIKRKEVNKTDNTRCPLSVINIKNKLKKNNHPTEKPHALYEWLLKRYCPTGGTVLDPTAGSFNSVIVARQIGLNAIGIEMDEGFYNKAIEKIIEEPE
jgi:site-specific DNA-methyltransferase (adenine-specific)